MTSVGREDERARGGDERFIDLLVNSVLDGPSQSATKSMVQNTAKANRAEHALKEDEQ